MSCKFKSCKYCSDFSCAYNARGFKGAKIVTASELNELKAEYNISHTLFSPADCGDYFRNNDLKVSYFKEEK